MKYLLKPATRKTPNTIHVASNYLPPTIINNYENKYKTAACNFSFYYGFKAMQAKKEQKLSVRKTSMRNEENSMLQLKFCGLKKT